MLAGASKILIFFLRIKSILFLVTVLPNNLASMAIVAATSTVQVY